jgi:hypothetical protein
MSIATLLHPNDPSFAFDHDQMHRNMYRSIPASVGFSGVPYQLDPLTDVSAPAGWWNSNHATAHRDFASAFPAITWPSFVSIADIDLSTGPTTWWAFANWQAHNLANQALSGG